MDRQGACSGDKIHLSTGGRPLSVIAGVASNRAKRIKKVSVLSIETLTEIAKPMSNKGRGKCGLMTITDILSRCNIF